MVAIIWFINREKLLLIFLWGVILMSGLARISISQISVQDIDLSLSHFEKQDVEITGEVLSVKQTKKGWKYLLKNQLLQNNNAVWKDDTKFFLYTDETQPIEVGDIVNAEGFFQKFMPPRNPGEFDFSSFYQRRGIWGLVFEDKSQDIVVVGEINSINKKISTLQIRIRNLFQEHVGGDAGNLLTALIVGLRDEIPKEIKDDFVDTGVIHVLAVSGLHVGYVLVILIVLVKIFRIPYGWNKIIIILLLMGYAVLTGGKSSVWRATLMASLFVIAPLFHRKSNLWNIIAVAALGLLIYKPDYLFDVGFLLSFSAVISIVFFLSQFEIILPKRLRVSEIQTPFLKYVFALFLVSVAAQIGTLPFTWSFFNRLPIISLIANVIIIPLIGVLVAMGFAILLLGSWIPFVGGILGNSAWLVSQIIFFLTKFFSNVPFAYLELATPSFLQVFQYMALIGTLFFIFRVGWKNKGVLACLLCANLFVLPWSIEKKQLDVIFLDVGQGDAILVRVPTSDGLKTILIDAGMKSFSRDMGERIVLPVLKHFGIKEVDVMVMSHPHSDHIGGVETLLKNITIHEVWDTFFDYQSHIYQRILKKIDQDSISYQRMKRGLWENSFEPAQIFILHPDSLYAATETSANNASIVFKLVYGQVSFLFVGDLEKEGDEEMLQFGQILKTDVLKVGHHGSITSTTESFLNLVKPDYAVISVGDRNKFNHPSEIVLSRLKESGAEIYRTDIDHAIWFKSDGKRLWVHDWR
ncbi:MAG: DNA internalization-related competence protein ComEC/Rec2 [Candidatus Marinimicrobia bacterium]|nr:DNA internalization-related competence protein ComEC/Rec2 [Candidatus Neomarinimicrobiota bacterium]